MTETRIDPDDGMPYTFAELSTHYKGTYNKKDIESYWQLCPPLTEKRIDPVDGMPYTFAELSSHYKGTYNNKAIESYWQACQPAPKVKSKAKADSKAKAKAKAKGSGEVRLTRRQIQQEKYRTAGGQMADEWIQKWIAEKATPPRNCEDFKDFVGQHFKVYMGNGLIGVESYAKDAASGIVGANRRKWERAELAELLPKYGHSDLDANDKRFDALMGRFRAIDANDKMIEQSEGGYDNGMRSDCYEEIRDDQDRIAKLKEEMALSQDFLDDIEKLALANTVHF